MSGRLVAHLVLLIVCVGARATECDEWRQRHPEWLWCDSFESPAALDSYEDRKTTADSPDGMDISMQVAFDGSRSLRQHYKIGQVSAGWIVKVEDFPDNLFVRWYHRFPVGFTRFPQKMARIGYRNRLHWREVMRVHAWIQSIAGQFALVADTLARDSSQSNSAGWLSVSPSDHYLDAVENRDRWIAYEVQIKLNTPCHKDGLYRVWADDALLIERTNIDLRGCQTYGINEVMLDTYWNDGATGEINRYYDNFVISTSRIGLYSAVSPPKPPVLEAH